MITASIGSHRFQSGPTYHFNGSNTKELIGIVQDPTKTVDYVNVLPKVEATEQEIRDIAASGIARLAVQGSNIVELQRAGNALVAVCDGGTLDESDFTDRFSGQDVFRGLSLNNQVLDSASVLATRINRVAETAGIITAEAPTDEGYFVIALANGGLISAARTFLQIGEGNNRFGIVRYSRYKNGDEKPKMSPYPTERINWLTREAKGRQVVVIDEDYSAGKTMKFATNFFADLLETKVLGIAPVEVERRITYKPLVIKSD